MDWQHYVFATAWIMDCDVQLIWQRPKYAAKKLTVTSNTCAVKIQDERMNSRRRIIRSSLAIVVYVDEQKKSTATSGDKGKGTREHSRISTYKIKKIVICTELKKNGGTNDGQKTMRKWEKKNVLFEFRNGTKKTWY